MIDQHNFKLMFVIIFTIGFKRAIQVSMDDNCYEDMTGKRGRMSQDDYCLVNLQDISGFSYI